MGLFGWAQSTYGGSDLALNKRSGNLSKGREGRREGRREGGALLGLP